MYCYEDKNLMDTLAFVHSLNRDKGTNNTGKAERHFRITCKSVWIKHRFS